MPALTRCDAGTKFQNVWKKKDKPVSSQRRCAQSNVANGDTAFGVPQLCVRTNTLQRIRAELEVLEKRIITLLRNSESEDFSNGLGKKLFL